MNNNFSSERRKRYSEKVRWTGSRSQLWRNPIFKVRNGGEREVKVTVTIIPDSTEETSKHDPISLFVVEDNFSKSPQKGKEDRDILSPRNEEFKIIREYEKSDDSVSFSVSIDGSSFLYLIAVNNNVRSLNKPVTFEIYSDENTILVQRMIRFAIPSRNIVEDSNEEEEGEGEVQVASNFSEKLVVKKKFSSSCGVKIGENMTKNPKCFLYLKKNTTFYVFLCQSKPRYEKVGIYVLKNNPLQLKTTRQSDVYLKKGYVNPPDLGLEVKVSDAPCHLTVIAVAKRRGSRKEVEIRIVADWKEVEVYPSMGLFLAKRKSKVVKLGLKKKKGTGDTTRSTRTRPATSRRRKAPSRKPVNIRRRSIATDRSTSSRRRVGRTKAGGRTKKKGGRKGGRKGKGKKNLQRKKKITTKGKKEKVKMEKLNERKAAEEEKIRRKIQREREEKKKKHQEMLEEREQLEKIRRERLSTFKEKKRKHLEMLEGIRRETEEREQIEREEKIRIERLSIIKDRFRELQRVRDGEKIELNKNHEKQRLEREKMLEILQKQEDERRKKLTLLKEKMKRREKEREEKIEREENERKMREQKEIVRQEIERKMIRTKKEREEKEVVRIIKEREEYETRDDLTRKLILQKGVRVLPNRSWKEMLVYGPKKFSVSEERVKSNLFRNGFYFRGNFYDKEKVDSKNIVLDAFSEKEHEHTKDLVEFSEGTRKESLLLSHLNIISAYPSVLEVSKIGTYPREVMKMAIETYKKQNLQKQEDPYSREDVIYQLCVMKEYSLLRFSLRQQQEHIHEEEEEENEGEEEAEEIDWNRSELLKRMKTKKDREERMKILKREGIMSCLHPHVLWGTSKGDLKVGWLGERFMTPNSKRLELAREFYRNAPSIYSHLPHWVKFVTDWLPQDKEMYLQSIQKYPWIPNFEKDQLNLFGVVSTEDKKWKSAWKERFVKHSHFDYILSSAIVYGYFDTKTSEVLLNELFTDFDPLHEDLRYKYDEKLHIPNAFMMFCCENGCVESLKLLLSERFRSYFDPACSNNYPIRFASKNGRVEVLKVLLEHSRSNKKIDCKANDYEAFFSCIEKGHPEVLKLLVDEIDETDPRSIIHRLFVHAAKFDQLEYKQDRKDNMYFYWGLENYLCQIIIDKFGKESIRWEDLKKLPKNMAYDKMEVVRHMFLETAPQSYNRLEEYEEGIKKNDLQVYIRAVEKGHLDVVKQLIIPKLLDSDDFDETRKIIHALIVCAAKYEEVDIFNFLIESFGVDFIDWADLKKKPKTEFLISLLLNDEKRIDDFFENSIDALSCFDFISVTQASGCLSEQMIMDYLSSSYDYEVMETRMKRFMKWTIRSTGMISTGLLEFLIQECLPMLQKEDDYIFRRVELTHEDFISVCRRGTPSILELFVTHPGFICTFEMHQNNNEGLGCAWDFNNWDVIEYLTSKYKNTKRLGIRNWPNFRSFVKEMCWRTSYYHPNKIFSPKEMISHIIDGDDCQWKRYHRYKNRLDDVERFQNVKLIIGEVQMEGTLDKELEGIDKKNEIIKTALHQLKIGERYDRERGLHLEDFGERVRYIISESDAESECFFECLYFV